MMSGSPRDRCFELFSRFETGCSWAPTFREFELGSGSKQGSSGSPGDRSWESEYYREKEFLRGFIAEIGIDPDAGRGVITFYERLVSSLMCMVGAGVEPAGAEGPRDFKDTGEGQRTKDLANSLPFSRTRSTSRESTVRGVWTPR